MLLSNRSSQYQNQYSLVNEDGWLPLGAPRRHILALPPELLADIFFFCLPFDEDLIVRPDPDDAPLVLCAVCRQWRALALTTPKLWSSVYFVWDFWEPNAALYVDLCRNWISRARSTPLSLMLSTNASDPAVDSLLEIIGEVSQQWQNIQLGGALPFSFPFPGNGKYPLLEKLRNLPFRASPIRSADAIVPRCAAIARRFHHDIYDKDTASFPPVNQAHLRISWYDASALPNTVFSLPQLRSLNLGGTWMEMLPISLLKCLKTPALRTLALGFEDARNRAPADVSSFLSFVSQSAFKLHTLTLSCLPVTPGALLECLKATPSVIHLKLQIWPGIVDMNPVFAAFTGHRDFLPNLESFGLAFSTWQPTVDAPIVDASVVVDMLIWRCLTSTVTRLQSFVYDSYDLEETVQSYIKAHSVYPELEALGVNLDLDEGTDVGPFVDVLP
ncbi:hypothetical protein B0H14DRAFT_3443371 [Mycena olivaceomarginata]|nr:hypothetical protein B0H14DRAFT_3443371 [Mycena olivaceomarginata]